MAIDPAATSARPAITTIRAESTAPERPAASANGTVRPSDMPMTMSRTASLAVKWRSWWGVCGTELPRPLLHRPGVLRDVEAAVDAIAGVAHAVRVDVEVVELDVPLALRRWRAEEADLLGPVRVRDVVDAHPRVEPRREDELLAHEAAGIVFVDIMGAKPVAEIVEALDACALEGLGAREAADHDRLALIANVDHPNAPVAIPLVRRHVRLTHLDQESTAGQRH